MKEVRTISSDSTPQPSRTRPTANMVMLRISTARETTSWPTTQVELRKSRANRSPSRSRRQPLRRGVKA